MNPKERLIKDLKETISRYLALFEDDDKRLQAAMMLASIVELPCRELEEGIKAKDIAVEKRGNKNGK